MRAVFGRMVSVFVAGLFTAGGLLLVAGVSGASAESAYSGYTLFNPNGDYNTYLINMNKQIVHTWYNTAKGGYSVYLLPNGNLMRPGEDPSATLRGAAFSGLLQEIDWDGNVVWQYKYSSTTYNMHHDIKPMPNGNVLVIAWDKKTATDVQNAGFRAASEMWFDSIVEINRTTSSIQWEWHAWDHLVQDYDNTKANYGVVKNHPELLDINLAQTSPKPGEAIDWLHVNSVSYNPVRDEIAISSHMNYEVYIIDHSTTTAEASGHSGGARGKGGDLLYRWGKPSNFGGSGPTTLDVCHCAEWIQPGLPGAGNLFVFNNGDSTDQSQILELAPPVALNGSYEFTPGVGYGPDSPAWAYSDGTNFFSFHLGSNQRLPNGNTLISESTVNHLFEVDSAGNVVWEYTFTKQIARSLRYAPDYPGLSQIVPDMPAPALPALAAGLLATAAVAAAARTRSRNKPVP